MSYNAHTREVALYQEPHYPPTANVVEAHAAVKTKGLGKNRAPLMSGAFRSSRERTVLGWEYNGVWRPGAPSP